MRAQIIFRRANIKAARKAAFAIFKYQITLIFFKSLSLNKSEKIFAHNINARGDNDDLSSKKAILKQIH